MTTPAWISANGRMRSTNTSATKWFHFEVASVLPARSHRVKSTCSSMVRLSKMISIFAPAFSRSNAAFKMLGTPFRSRARETQEG
eukprot:10259366-Lingulodinium_polyedra.AAC.1